LVHHLLDMYSVIPFSHLSTMFLIRNRLRNWSAWLLSSITQSCSRRNLTDAICYSSWSTFQPLYDNKCTVCLCSNSSKGTLSWHKRAWWHFPFLEIFHL
jgi:hypothetical protein